MEIINYNNINKNRILILQTFITHYQTNKQHR